MYPKQVAAIFDPNRISLIEASTKAGKAQPLDAIVYTPVGPVRMGDLRIGDSVLTPDGGRAPVVAIHPQAGERRVSRVTFSDGASTEADDDHLWEVHEFGVARPRLFRTAELMTWPIRRLRRAWVPAINSVDFDASPVPVDPYAIGLLLGDGGLTPDVIRFSSCDSEIVETLRAALPPGHQLVKLSRGWDYVVSARSGAAALREAGAHLRGKLTALGLTGKGAHEKAIPPSYKYNSAEVRRTVLQGLLDTDGFVDKHGQPGIEQTSPQLAKDIEEIVRSLGGTVLTRYRALNGYRREDGSFVQCRPVWRQVIRFADAAWCFRLERKRAKVRPKRKTGHRFFRQVEYSRSCPTQCIEIDDPRHLYLTDDLIPTHNTVGCIIWLVEQALFGGGDGRNYWWIAPVTLQANIAFVRMLRYLPRGTYTANRSLKSIVLMNGAIIWFKGADRPDSLYGEDVYAAVIDEASRVKETAWLAVRTTLVATRGPIRAIGNVKGKMNWFYRLARRAQLGAVDMGYHKITAYDAVASGVLVKEEIEAAKSEMTAEAFKELFLAEAADDGSNPFGEAHIRACVRPMSSKPAVVWGWDLAKKRDWTVGIGLDEDDVVCRFERFQKPWGATVEHIILATARRPALVDSTGVGDPVLEQLQSHPKGGDKFEGYQFTGPSKQKLMEGLAVAIGSTEVFFPEGQIVDELLQFEYEYTKGGVRYSAPAGVFDDCVMALALARMHSTHAPKPWAISAGAIARARIPRR